MLLLSLAIRHGFVEAMEMDNSTEQVNLASDSEGEAVNAGHGCRLVVLHLLIEGINFPHPSLSHFLLGFNIQAPLSKYLLFFFFLSFSYK